VRRRRVGGRLALADATFRDGRLVHALLVHELEQAVIRAFSHRGGGVEDGKGGGLWLPRFRVPPRRRGLVSGCGIAIYQCCTCQYCCRDPFPGPWAGEPRGTCGCDCDCCPCDCCDCCDCSP